MRIYERSIGISNFSRASGFYSPVIILLEVTVVSLRKTESLVLTLHDDSTTKYAIVPGMWSTLKGKRYGMSNHVLFASIEMESFSRFVSGCSCSSRLRILSKQLGARWL